MQGYIILLILCCYICGKVQSTTSGSSCAIFGGNGVCDDFNNVDECDWDGGDCCECSCEGNNCGDEGYDDCIDPDVPPSAVDGSCDPFSPCVSEIKDCCPCICSDCSETDCVFPNSPKQLYDCKRAPSSIPPCEDGLPGEVVIHTTAQARDLAETINCSGGVFSVSWRGHVVVDQTLWVINGTVLNVIGNGSSAEMDGNGVTRLFTVVNASLQISGMMISNGNATGGGAIASSASVLILDRTIFAGNNALKDGGAIFATEGSNISFVDQTIFVNNTASSGGALYMTASSNATWTGESFFTDNDGGALSVRDGSMVSWTEQITFSDQTGNAALELVGNSSAVWKEAIFSGNNKLALSVGERSTVRWEGGTKFSGNSHPEKGGAIYVYGNSSVSWTAETTFFNNNASRGGALAVETYGGICWTAATSFSGNTASEEGGAIYTYEGGNVSWTGETYFSNNNASRGGALFVGDGGGILWSSTTNFSSNTALFGGGGAIFVEGGGAIWTGETIFSVNIAYNFGGAVAVVGGRVVWGSTTSFFENSLWVNQQREGRGGALFIGDSGGASWTGQTIFENNTAGDRGGGIFITSASTLEWSGKTYFTSNSAGSYGGAVGSEDLDRSLSLSTDGDGGQPSSINIAGTTYFVNNTCDGSGGGMALLRMLDFTLSGDDGVTFEGNSATISGGGVYISATEGGPLLYGMTFISNTAGAGGGLFAAASGTEINQSFFIGNYAEDTGGAIDSVNGVSSLMNTKFEGNKAVVGGALRLSGTATMSNCSFLENKSGVDGGPAVYNIGSFEYIRICSFLDNIFDCDAGTYFSFNGVGPKNATVCYECEICATCDYGDSNLIPTCEPALPHTTSNGGTIEELKIHAGYWRATNTSTKISQCFNVEACNGGVTGDPYYCEGGYGGAYCSVCSKTYAPGLGQSCTKCSDPTGGIILAIALTVFVIIVGAILILHLVSGEMGGSRRSLVDRIARNIPLHTLKIVIVTWQILTQFAEVARVTYPGVYQNFLNVVDLVNFDLSWVLSLECLVDVDFHGTMLFSTTGPIVIMGILGITYMIAARRHHGSTEALRKVWQKHLSMVLLITFLVYSSVSSVLLQMLDCDGLDDGKIYLRSDYSIQCDSDRHRALMLYSTIMILVYPVGIPVFYTYLLFSNRAVLMDDSRRETDGSVQSTTDLWKPYKPTRFYYEIIECVRRLLITVVVFLIEDDTTAQVSIIFMIAVCFALLLEILAPYKSRMDVWVSRTGHAVVYGSMYFALLLKTEISNDSQASQNVFEWVLITMQVILIVLVVINAAVLAYSSREENRVDARGRVAPRENFAGLLISNRHMITRVRALSNPRRQMLVVHPS